MLKKTLMLSLFAMFLINMASGQYFGRYKPGYKTFEYKVYETPHFEIYHDLEDDSALNKIAFWAEEWYRMHQRVFKDTFRQKNPLLIYKNHADFQQTNAVSSMISVGTGGVTEVMKNRVVMPFTIARAQTDHVLGHELVHAFQFNMLTGWNPDTTVSPSLRNLPLWMVEGMSEYLSIGPVDPTTAMWVRDGILNDDFPTLKDLQNPKYFPYRWGHSFWSMVAQTWGDTVIAPIFMQTALYGYEKAIDSILGVSPETLSNMWKSANTNFFEQYLKDSVDQLVGKKTIFEENAGEVNVTPSVSPDGEHVIFLSEKDIFTLDLFLANAKTGKIIKKVYSTVQRNEIDAFNSLESAGSWSPDNEKFAITVFSKGRNKLVIVDVKKGKMIKEYTINGVPALTQPAWSPDGEKIAFVGLVEGYSNLYMYYPAKDSVVQLTDDRFSYMFPSWSPDGSKLAFSTDREAVKSFRPNQKLYLANMDMATREIEVYNVFPGADNINPVFSVDGESMYFLSDRDGFRNLYNYHILKDSVYQLTGYMTGITGITQYSPAISVARDSNEIAYSYYFNGKYSIIIADGKDFSYRPVEKNAVDFTAAHLPPSEYHGPNLVKNGMENREKFVAFSEREFEKVPYQPKFKLDYISNVNAGVSTSPFGTGMAGSVSAMFSDMVGDNQLYTSLAIQGEVYDFGGMVGYMNRKHQLDWGASVSHVPYLRMGLGYNDTSFISRGDTIDVRDVQLDYLRMFEDQISVFAFYPLSITQRFEASVSHAWYYYRLDRYHTYYQAGTPFAIGQERERVEEQEPDGFNLQQASLAFVTDNSYFGFTSPLRGGRSRFEIGKYFGRLKFYSALADYRKYIFLKPAAFAFRLMHRGRYGATGQNNLMYPLYIGYPWYVRGYYGRSSQNLQQLGGQFVDYNNMMGTRMVLGNVEFRLPFSGPERLALISSKYFITELAFFFDGGVAWIEGEEPVLKWQPDGNDERIPIFSTGASVRVNLFGAMILEPYAAIPFQWGGVDNISFGLNFTPGW